MMFYDQDRGVLDAVKTLDKIDILSNYPSKHQPGTLKS